MRALLVKVRALVIYRYVEILVPVKGGKIVVVLVVLTLAVLVTVL